MEQTSPLLVPIYIIEDLLPKFTTYIYKAIEPLRGQKYNI